VGEDLYCSRADVNDWLPSGEIAGSSRLAASSRASSDTLSLDGHGFETGARVRVRALEGGTLSAPLVEGTVYYVVRLTSDTFQLSASEGGAAINLTTDGVSMLVSKEPQYEKVIEFWSRWADTFFPAHSVPFGRAGQDVHPLVRGCVAQLSAKSLLNIDGKSSEILNAARADAQKILERHAAGLPLRGAPVPSPTNLAVSASASSGDPRGWGSGGCLP
jgi:hypothetical protein